MLKPHLADRVGDTRRLADVVLRRPTVGDGAIRTVSRADVAKDHERGRAMLPAFADVGAVRFLANRMQVEVAHQLLQAKILGAAGGTDLEPAGLALRQGLRAMAASDLIECLAHPGQRV